MNNESFVSCLFGEQLLKEHPHNPVALVEAPKTAIIGTLYFGFPQVTQNLLWLAVYNLSSLTLKKVKVLSGRRIFLFPDLSENGKAFELWEKKAQEFSLKMPSTSFQISDFLESNASEDHRLKGQDLADFLIQLDWRNFRKKNEKTEETEHQNKIIFSDERKYPEDS